MIRATVSDELTTVWEDWSHETPQPTARLQERVYWDAPIVTEFCVQLEYNTRATFSGADPSWLPVARFDHNVSPDHGHDIRDEGLHLDVYNGYGKEFVDTGFGTPPLTEAPRICRDYLEEHKERYLAEFERRINVNSHFRYYDS